MTWGFYINQCREEEMSVAHGADKVTIWELELLDSPEFAVVHRDWSTGSRVTPHHPTSPTGY